MLSIVAQDAQLKEEFLLEGPKGWSRLKALTSHVEGWAELTEGTPPEWHVSKRWRFKVNGEMLRQETDNFDKLTKFQSGKAIVKNSKYSFELGRMKLESDWALVELHVKEPDIRYDAFFLSAKGGIMTFLPIPWCLPLGTPFVDLIGDPRFTLKTITRDEFQGMACVNVEFDYQPKKDLDQKDPINRSLLALIEGGRLRFLPDNAWALASAELRLGVGSSTCAVDYEGTRDSLPVIRRITGGSTMQPGFKQQVEFHDLVFGPIPESEFTLSAFGLPEPQGVVRPNKGTPWYLWFLGGGVVALVSAAYLRHRIRRRQFANGAKQAPSVSNPSKVTKPLNDRDEGI